MGTGCHGTVGLRSRFKEAVVVERRTEARCQAPAQTAADLGIGFWLEREGRLRDRLRRRGPESWRRLEHRGGTLDDYAFPSCSPVNRLSRRQCARLFRRVGHWDRAVARRRWHHAGLCRRPRLESTVTRLPDCQSPDAEIGRTKATSGGVFTAVVPSSRVARWSF